MIDPRPVLMVIGLLLLVLALGMGVPALADLASGHGDWTVFLTSGAVTGFVGGALFLAFRGGEMRFTLRQAFLLTTLSWVALVAFAALPFVFCELQMTYTDSFFEAMSGVTTTGSTVITGLDGAPPGILLWRAILQWLGGIGIIVLAVAVLPILRIGGMQLFRMESSDRSEKVAPRVAQIAASIGGLYVLLTLAWTVMLAAAGLEGFEALAHAMTTIATGGYSTRDGSIGAFDSAAVDYIVVGGMVVGSLPFVLYLRAVRGDPRALLRDQQVRGFLAVLLVVVALMVVNNITNLAMPAAEAVRYALFNVTSIMTGTGYSTADYAAWGSFAVIAFLLIKFIGGCAGSTSCGIKIFRFQVLYTTAMVQMKRLLQPHGVYIPYYNGRAIPAEVSTAVLGFFFLFVASFAALAGLLALLGLDVMTSLSGAATAMANVGPGLGDVIGPTGNFAGLPDGAKWLLAAGMLLGRLELFTVLVLVLPSFWRE